MIRAIFALIGDLAELFALSFVIAAIILICIAMTPDPTPDTAHAAHGQIMFAEK